MNQRIDLSPTKFSLNTNRWIFSLSGVFFLFNTVVQIINQPESWWNWILIVGTIGIGLANFIAAFVIYTPASVYAPRIEVDEHRILIKNDIFKKAHNILWKDIKQLSLSSFQTSFVFKDDSSHDFRLSTPSSEISKEAKGLLRKEAEARSILVQIT